MNNFISCVLALHLGVHSAFEWKEELINSPTYTYPYCDLEEMMNREGKETIQVFSYGSLLDYDSARKTLSPKTMITGQKAVAMGVRRVFDRDVPVDPTHDWGVPCDPNSRAMLNLHATGNPDDITNGVIYQLRIEDIPAVREREHGYDLKPILVSTWENYMNGDKSEYFIAYTFHSPKESHFTHDNIYPRPGYYELTRDAAKERGPDFYQMWIESTYLSDEVTPISEWEKVVRSKNPRSLKYDARCLYPNKFKDRFRLRESSVMRRL